jgi:hypothetical protein
VLSPTGESAGTTEAHKIAGSEPLHGSCQRARLQVCLYGLLIAASFHEVEDVAAK